MLPRLPRALPSRERQLFIALTIVVGVLAGLVAVLFTLAIDRTSRLLFGFDPGPTRLFVVPGLMSLVTGTLLATVFKGARGSGIPQTKAAYHLHDGAIPARVPFGKFLTGVLCIGSGHSLGREGPSVQIGAGVASAVGRWLRLPPERVRDLLPVGAAGALAAAFNTPVAAVIFALEEIIGDMNASLLGSTVVASVASVVVERALLGNEPLFHVPTYHLAHPAELIGYAALGVIGGVLSIVFCKALLGLRGLFQGMPRATVYVQPALGGLAIGAMLLVIPQVKGVGYEYVDQALNGGLVLRTLLLLCVAKTAATVVSYASGNAGGIFAPTLYIGAMAGGALGVGLEQFSPVPMGDPGAYALVGMGTLFAGIIRAPMTSVFMIFEITQDYQILVPLMVANLLSFAISRKFQPAPIYHALLEQDHVHLPAPGAAGAGVALVAADLMTSDLTFVPPNRPAADALRDAQASHARAQLVGDREHLCGVIRTSRLAEIVQQGAGDTPVAELVDRPGVHAHPDQALDVVGPRLTESGGLLPIVSRTDTRRVTGVVTADTMVRAIWQAGHSRGPREAAPGSAGTKSDAPGPTHGS